MFIFKTVLKNDKIVIVGSHTNGSGRPRTACVCPSPSTTGPLRHNVLFTVSLIGVMDGMVAVSSSVEKCLKNSKILQKIFNHVSEDPTDNLEMRLVNRLFDVEYLHRIRRTHRSIFLTFLADSYDMETLQGIRVIKVNERVIQSNKAEKYVKFLTETVGVRVESFRMKVENYCYGMYRERCGYHRLIIEQLLKNQRLKVLTGIEDICPKGCSECVRHARTCEEYGPLQMNVYLDSYQEPRHYKKLIVSEMLLHELANQAMHLKKTREECLEFVKVYRKPKITCSDFCLSLSECCFRHQSKPVDMALIGSFSEVYPQEIIEEMCRNWKPKSAQVVVGGRRSAFESRSDWRFKHFFTEFSFEQKLPDYGREHKMEFESLNIDIQDAEMQCYYLYNEDKRCSNHLIANFRNLFPSRTVTVKTYRFPSTRLHYYPKETFDEATFRRILETVWGKNPEKHWKLTLNHMLTVPTVEFQIPGTFTFRNRQISCVALPTFVAEATIYDSRIRDYCFTQYTVKPYCITDEENDRVLNFELFFETRTAYKSRRVEAYGVSKCALG